MESLANFLAFVIGLTFVAAAFLYPVNPSRGAVLLRRLMLYVVVSFGALAIACRILAAVEGHTLWAGALLVSLTAYLVREARLDRKEKSGLPTRVERTPTLPQAEETTG